MHQFINYEKRNRSKMFILQSRTENDKKMLRRSWGVGGGAVRVGYMEEIKTASGERPQWET